jgi:hypothetical protein
MYLKHFTITRALSEIGAVPAGRFAVGWGGDRRGEMEFRVKRGRSQIRLALRTRPAI